MKNLPSSKLSDSMSFALLLLWDDFQPEPTSVAKDKLDSLVKVADIAAESGLALDLTFFTDHMSGPNWSPRWLLGGDLPPAVHQNWLRDVISEGKKTGKGYRNMFHDEMALTAERLLLKTVVSTLKDHPGIWMWNLGNEPDLPRLSSPASTASMACRCAR